MKYRLKKWEKDTNTPGTQRRSLLKLAKSVFRNIYPTTSSSVDRGQGGVSQKQLYKKNLHLSKYGVGKLRERFQVVYGIIACISFLACIYIWLFSSYFKIQSVVIAKTINEYDISQLHKLVTDTLQKDSLLLDRHNIITVPTDDISQTILEHYHVKTLSLSKNILDRTLSIRIDELDPYVLLVQNESYFYMDGAGQILKAATRENIDTQLPILYYEMPEPVYVGQTVIPADTAGYIPQIVKTIEDATPLRVIALKVAQLQTVRADVLISETPDETDLTPQYELTILTERGFQIRLGSIPFRQQQLIASQLATLVQAVNTNLSASLDTIAYIDARFIDHLYIATK